MTEVLFYHLERRPLEQVLPTLKSGDLVITLGAGDIWKAGLAILDRLPA